MIRTLTAADLDAAHAAFLAAFSDYAVPLALSRGQLAEMLARRGWVPELSVAAFDGDAMVAFTLNCVDGDLAYDSGTGVVPAHRRRGLARELMERSFELLRAHGCRAYVLEVLDSNERAIALYRSLGFEEQRGLQCWTCERPGSSRRIRGEGEQREEWWSVQPSWQNSSRSLGRARDAHERLGTADGYAIVFPATGDLPQLAVAPHARRRGLGMRLLDEAARIAGKPLRIINVDERDAGIAAFLERAGARRTVRQLELSKPL